jgi:nondiscriminating aspartyl-tRNA synthetase
MEAAKGALDGLGSWRRTHYSTDLSPKDEGREVVLFGMVASIRRQGAINFLIISDCKGLAQIVIDPKAGEWAAQKLKLLKRYSFVGVRGRARAMDKAPRGVEVVPTELKILSIPSKDPPFDMFGRRGPSLEKRLDIRAVDMRRPHVKALFKIRDSVVRGIRAFLCGRGFMEVNTPKLISSATEGGSALFPLLYYDKEAFLAQSPQLYKEQLVGSFERVYEIGPIFRAEKFSTDRHLSESTSVDAEMAYVDYNDVMDLLEDLIKYVVKKSGEECGDELELIGAEPMALDGAFERFSYGEVFEDLRAKGVPLSWGDDLSAAQVRSAFEGRGGFFFIKDWPTKSKAFYIRPRGDDPKICEGFDLFCGSMEIASGGTRVDSGELLRSRLIESGLNPASFRYHLEVFDYGMPPHAGFGMGLERLLMVMTRRENIREVAFFPRDPSRLIP